MDTRAAFMGLAIVNFATNDDLNRGPAFTTCDLNPRQMNNKRQEDFIRALGGDPLDYSKPLKDLSRFDPEHAIIILVERRFVNIDSLVKNPLDVRDLDTVKHVKWTDKENFGLSQATVANGNGRIELCRTILAPKLIKEYHEIKHTMKSQLSEHTMSLLKARREVVCKQLEARASWLVAFYDLGKPSYYLRKPPPLISIMQI